MLYSELLSNCADTTLMLALERHYGMLPFCHSTDYAIVELLRLCLFLCVQIWDAWKHMKLLNCECVCYR